MGRYELRTYKPLGRLGTGAWDGPHPHKHWGCSKVYKKVGRVGWDVLFLTQWGAVYGFGEMCTVGMQTGAGVNQVERCVKKETVRVGKEARAMF